MSRYPFLKDGASEVPDHWDMGQLSSTASSAHKVAEWLKAADLPVPLATLRLLLSPAPSETHLAGVASPAALDAFVDHANLWRKDASGNRENHTFFYFAGHGVQRAKDDAVFCMEDFRRPNNPRLRFTVDLANVRVGMSPAPGREEIARTQFYFVDACRVQPAEQKNFEPMETTAVFDKDLAGEDDRRSPVFYASISNKAALAVPGKQTLFSDALLNGLGGVAGDSLGEDENGNDVWGVSVTSLDRALRERIADLNRQHGADQTYTQGGQFTEATVCRLPGPPQVDVELSIDPETARELGHLVVLANDDLVRLDQPAPVAPHPVKVKLEAGLYSVIVDFESPGAPFGKVSKFKPARAPRASWKVTVA